MLDPRLIPLVPPAVTTDPARQYHALLGLPPQTKPPEVRQFDLDTLVGSLSSARAKIVRGVLNGEECSLRRALVSFLEDPKFRALPFEEQRKALAAFDLRR